MSMKPNWQPVETPRGYSVRDVRDVDNEKCITGWGHVTQTKEEAELISAAPDLLECVEAMLEEYENGRNIQPFEIREMCRRAKYKAYGQQY